jgi:hypothetical protein
MKTITFFLICLGLQAHAQEFSIFNQTGKKKISHTDIAMLYNAFQFWQIPKFYHFQLAAAIVKMDILPT